MDAQTETVEPEVVNEKAVALAETGGNELVKYAMGKGADIATLKELMALQERDDANKARKAYHKAMAAFKADPPTIEKTAEVDFKNKAQVRTHYFHADLALAAEAISISMGQHGLSFGWKTPQEGNTVTVICTITHELGHSESTSMTAGPDLSGGKDAIQGLSSTVTRLERYTLLALTGLAAKGQDKEDPPDADPDTYKIDQWLARLQEWIDTDGITSKELAGFWGQNEARVKKDLPRPADSSKIHEAWQAAVAELQKKEAT